MDLFTELHCFPLYPPAAEAAQRAPPFLGSGHGHQSHGPLQHGHAHQQRARANQHHQYKRSADGATTGRVRSPDGREHLHHQHRFLPHHRHQRRLHLRQQDQRVKTETVFIYLFIYLYIGGGGGGGGGGEGEGETDFSLSAGVSRASSEILQNRWDLLLFLPLYFFFFFFFFFYCLCFKKKMYMRNQFRELGNGFRLAVEGEGNVLLFWIVYAKPV